MKDVLWYYIKIFLMLLMPVFYYKVVYCLI